MMIDNTVLISFDVDKDLKESIKNIVMTKYGISIEKACVLFLEESVRCNGIPFEINE